MSLWLLIPVFFPLALLIAAVVLPVRFRLRAQVDQASRLRLDVHAFGGVTPALCLVDTASKQKKAPHKPEKKSSAGSKSGISRISESGVLRLVVEVIRQFKFIWLQGEAEFGFDDPADTGAVFGMIAPVVYTGKYGAGFDFDIKPNFNRCCVRGKIDAAVELIPVRIIPPVLRFGWANIRSEIWNR